MLWPVSSSVDSESFFFPPKRDQTNPNEAVREDGHCVFLDKKIGSLFWFSGLLCGF